MLPLAARDPHHLEGARWRWRIQSHSQWDFRALCPASPTAHQWLVLSLLNGAWMAWGLLGAPTVRPRFGSHQLSKRVSADSNLPDDERNECDLITGRE